MPSIRFPVWTLTAFGILLATAIATGSLFRPLAPATLAGWGYASVHFGAESWRALVSPFFTHGSWHAWFALLMILLCVGTLERRAGTAVAFTLFWVAHIGTLVVAYGIYSLALWLGVHAGLVADIFTANDVGASAGYFGCLSAAGMLYFPRRGWLLTGLLAVFFVAVLAWHRHSGAPAFALSADISHAIAVLIAAPAGRLLRRY